MPLPRLVPTARSREYNAYSEDLRARVVYVHLFEGLSHRELDEEVLGLDRNYSRGYQSMGILHHLGLKKGYRGVFVDVPPIEALAQLDKAGSDFALIAHHVRVALTERGREGALPTFEEHRVSEQEEVRKSLSDQERDRLRRIDEAPRTPDRIAVTATVFRRNPDVAAQTLVRANGCCEWCGNPAPFVRETDGTPYLEVHHTVPLAEGGEDTLANTVALCPNCHRLAHYGRHSDVSRAMAGGPLRE